MTNDEYNLDIAREMLENPEVVALGLSVETLASLVGIRDDVTIARVQRSMDEHRMKRLGERGE